MNEWGDSTPNRDGRRLVKKAWHEQGIQVRLKKRGGLSADVSVVAWRGSECLASGTPRAVGKEELVKRRLKILDKRSLDAKTLKTEELGSEKEP